MAIEAQSPLLGTQELMENGWVSRSFFYLQQQQQKIKQQLQQQEHIQNQQQMYQNQNLLVSSSLKNNMINTNTSGLPSMPFYQSLAAQEEKQRQEMDQYIISQNERLRLILREQRKQQLIIVLKTIESTTLPLLRQKDEEIAQASKRAMELEDFLKRLEMENQAWQRMAQENQAMVVSLNNTLDQLIDNKNHDNNDCCAGFNGGDAEDAESCCDVDEEKKTEMNAEDKTRMVCGGCKSRNSCVLFLPCRHLCSCRTCEAFLDSCPICNTVKNASIEVLL